MRLPNWGRLYGEDSPSDSPGRLVDATTVADQCPTGTPVGANFSKSPPADHWYRWAAGAGQRGRLADRQY